MNWQSHNLVSVLSPKGRRIALLGAIVLFIGGLRAIKPVAQAMASARHIEPAAPGGTEIPNVTTPVVDHRSFTSLK
jgi:hypothetical protein